MLTDVFIDLSRVEAGFDVRSVLEPFERPELLGSIVGRVTCAVLPDDPAAGVASTAACRVCTTGPVAACRDAIAAAADAQRSLLVLLGDIRPTAAAVGLLVEAIESDPMIGFAIARLTGVDERSLARLDLAGDPAIDELPRRLIAELPETCLVADAPGRCLLIKPLVLTDFGELDLRFTTLAGAMWHYMTRARRCGFRTLVCNRAVVNAPCPSRPCPSSTISGRSLPEADRVLLRELSPDVERTRGEFGAGAAALAETRLARALPHAYGDRPSLLLDLRNVGAGVNGTTMAALGTSGGLHSLHSHWDVTVVASREASSVHRLEESFPNWTIATTWPERQFTVALRLSQPWHVQEMIDLHSAAAFNAYLFLDTISWDTVYPAPRHLTGTWQFMADHADALLFNSAYTRDRFRRRFRIPAGLRDLVAYHSFDPDEYTRPAVRMSSSEERFMFIVGNEYDHKDVAPTMELLAAAFPYQSIVALGPAKATTPRVRVLQSGTLSDADIHRLYAGAHLVLFPSFYEGFGFPILTTLAYGGTLVARESALLHEIAARSTPRGRIVPFTRRDELVEIVGRLLHGEDVAALPLGTALEHGQRPKSWRDVGEAILALLEDLTADLSRSRWRAREQTIAQLMAAPMSLAEKGLTAPVRAAERSSA
jgi:glycosyltransferase involved in cell wall biosynthesis